MVCISESKELHHGCRYSDISLYDLVKKCAMKKQNREKMYYIQSIFALLLLLGITLWGRRPESLWDLAVPAIALMILGLRAVEEKNQRAKFDFACSALWMLVTIGVLLV